MSHLQTDVKFADPNSLVLNVPQFIILSGYLSDSLRFYIKTSHCSDHPRENMIITLFAFTNKTLLKEVLHFSVYLFFMRIPYGGRVGSEDNS